MKQTQRFRKTVQRGVRAQLRDFYVLLLESRFSFLLFFATIFGGATILYVAYVDPVTRQSLTYSAALYGTFTLIFFEPVLAYPQQWYVQILFFVIPIVGLAAIADGILRFGTAVVNKQSRAQKWQSALASTYRDHIIVCGTGKLGYRIVQELLRYDRDLVGVERNAECRFLDAMQEREIPVLIADARRPENLIRAGVERADAIIPATDDELANVDIALHARELNPGIKVVLRMFDPDLARRVENGFGIHTAYSSSALAAPVFATAAMRVNVKHSFYVGDVLLALSEVTVAPESQLCGRRVKELESELDLSIVYYQSGEVHDIHPEPEQGLNGGDVILTLATLEKLTALLQMNLSAGIDR